MKAIKIIIKSALMYITMIYCILAMAAADSLTSKEILIVFTIGLILIFICKYTLSTDDINLLTGNSLKETKEDIWYENCKNKIH